MQRISKGSASNGDTSIPFVDMYTASQLHAKTNSITKTNYRASYDLFFGKRWKTRVPLLISKLEEAVVGENGKEELAGLRVYMVQRLVTSPIPIFYHAVYAYMCCVLHTYTYTYRVS
jgi:hypothetical protein